MSKETCVVSIADIYGAEWLERNKAELDREWEWGFGVAKDGDQVASVYASSVTPMFSNGPYIILHRRKPKPPTLREVYGTDEVKIPAGWEWTGEWRGGAPKDFSLDQFASSCTGGDVNGYRLILRQRQKKVWFKCEAEPRVPRIGDWFYSYGAWRESTSSGDGIYLCATRHEEVDQMVQVVTQADVDGVVQV